MVGIVERIFDASEVYRLRSFLPMSATSSRIYEHVTIRENAAERTAAIPLLARYVREAHETARVRFADSLGTSLDVRRRMENAAALRSYPRDSDMTTLKGFFGEIIAAVVTELYLFQKKRWRVPGFLFHTNDLLFAELLRRGSSRTIARPAFGHFGDDCIAFRTAKEADNITHLMICEAKCTATHRATLLADAHASLSEHTLKQTTLWVTRLIEGLRQNPTTENVEWIKVLETFRDSDRFINENRRDGVHYSHGKLPKQSPSWLDPRVKHAKHKSSTFLIAVEIYFDGIENLITSIYDTAYPI